METSGVQNRIWYLDRLRIACIFFVMLLHVAAAFWNAVPVGSTAFAVLNAYSGLSHFCVPCLVMISGALMLDPSRDASIATMLKKRAWRLALALAFWTLMYALVRTGWTWLAKRPGGAALWAYALDCLCKPIHLWFLYMMIGLYLVTPLLRAVTSDRGRTRYFLALSLLFAFLLPAPRRWVPAAGEISFLLSDEFVPFVLGYTGYFVLGRFLSESVITRKCEYGIYALGLVGLLLATVGATLLSRAQGAAFAGHLEYLSVPQLLISAAVFTLFLKHFAFEPKQSAIKRLSGLSGDSFSMYLVHLFFNEAFIAAGITAQRFNPLFSVPLIALAVFALSLLLTRLIRKIPFVRKYLT